MYPMSQKAAKLAVTPAIKLKIGLPPRTRSFTNMPNAAPNPPTHGPKMTAKIAGMMACGQNLTGPKLMGRTE